MLKIKKSRKNLARLYFGTLIALSGTIVAAVATTSALSEANREKFSQNDIIFYDPDGSASDDPTNPTGTGDCYGGGNGEGVAVSSSGTGEEKLWKGLTSFLSDEQAAAVMGNMWNESHLNPGAHGCNSGCYDGFDWINDTGKTGSKKTDYGIGIVQWSGGRRTNFLQCWILNIADCNNKYSRPEDYSDLIDIFKAKSTYGSHTMGINTFFEKAEANGIGDKASRLLAAELEYLRREINKTYSSFLDFTDIDKATVWFNTNYEGGSDYETRKKKAHEYYDKYHGTTGGNEENPSNPTSEDCGYGDDDTTTSGETGTNIAATAAKMSWPVQSGQSDDAHAGQCQTASGEWVSYTTEKDSCKDNPRPAYKSAKTSYGVGGYLRDCSRFVTTVLYAAGLDEGTLPKGGSAGTVTNWLANSSKWVELENTGKSMNLQPGDIFANTEHVSIYIGSYGGTFGSNAAASWQDWVGRITKYTASSSAILNGQWSSQGANKLPFRIFRYNAGTTGGDQNGENPGENPSGGQDPSGSENPSETPSEDPSGTPTPVGTGDCSNGCGKQDPSGMVAQQDYSYNWKTTADKDIATSGCSFISVVNAAKALGKSVDVASLASWTLNTKKISSAGWDTSVSPIASHLGLNLDSSYLYTSEGTNYSTKLAKIKEVIAKGGVVIAGGGGSGSGRQGWTCSSSQATNGSCVFSPGGHFITIIGVTSGNKLVVANPAKGSRSGQNWTYPAENVLKYSNKAKAVY